MRLCFRHNKEHLPLHVIYGPSQTCEEVRGGQTRDANRALCLICAAFRTTCTEALEIEASIPPIQIQVQVQAKRYAVRFNKLPLTNLVIQRLPNLPSHGNRKRYRPKTRTNPPIPHAPLEENSRGVPWPHNKPDHLEPKIRRPGPRQPAIDLVVPKVI